MVLGAELGAVVATVNVTDAPAGKYSLAPDALPGSVPRAVPVVLPAGTGPIEPTPAFGTEEIATVPATDCTAGKFAIVIGLTMVP